MRNMVRWVFMREKRFEKTAAELRAEKEERAKRDRCRACVWNEWRRCGKLFCILPGRKCETWRGVQIGHGCSGHEKKNAH